MPFAGVRPSAAASMQSVIVAHCLSSHWPYLCGHLCNHGAHICRHCCSDPSSKPEWTHVLLSVLPPLPLGQLKDETRIVLALKAACTGIMNR